MGVGTTFSFSDPIDKAGGKYWILSRGFAGPTAVPRGLHVTTDLTTFMSDVTANPTALQRGLWPATAKTPCDIKVAESSDRARQHDQQNALETPRLD